MALRFELRDGGFAGPCLTTWLCHRNGFHYAQLGGRGQDLSWLKLSHLRFSPIIDLPWHASANLDEPKEDREEETFDAGDESLFSCEMLDVEGIAEERLFHAIEDFRKIFWREFSSNAFGELCPREKSIV